MPSAHLYLFSDACPSDWLVDGQDDVWHTIVNFVFQSDSTVFPLIESGCSHEDVLPRDPVFKAFIGDLQGGLSSGALRKWRTSPSYRARFFRSFAAAQRNFMPIISACSFQEKTLRDSKAALIASYNERIGGSEGRGIGFEEFVDGWGRHQMKHSFVNFHGYHEVQAPYQQMLVLLFTAWFVADQFTFFFRNIVGNRSYGFDALQMTVVSDKLSGDNDFRAKSERNLRHLIDPETEAVPLVLTRSRTSDTFSADLLVDNLAGWLTAAISDPGSSCAAYARDLISSGVWTGWHQLEPSTSTLRSVPATQRLQSASAS